MIKRPLSVHLRGLFGLLFLLSLGRLTCEPLVSLETISFCLFQNLEGVNELGRS
ncbi:hypothetical protein [Methylorubrum extorquens]